MKRLNEKFNHVIFAVMIFLFLCSVQGLAAPIISIQPAASNQSVGTFFDVFVDIADVVDLYAFQFDTSFDPAVIKAITLNEGSFLPTGGGTFFIPGTIDNTSGLLTFTADSLLGTDPGVTGSGHLAVLSFVAFAQGATPISLSNVVLLDSSLSDIPFISNDSLVNVSVSAAPEPGTMLLLGLGLIGLAGVRIKMS